LRRREKTRDTFMNKTPVRSSILIVLLLSATVCFGQQHLVVIGGGKRPVDAMSKFVEWSGGKKGRILVITWATTEPEESFQGLKKELDTYGVEAIHAPAGPLDRERRELLIAEIKSATGVFFGGGDQNRIMDVLADKELADLLRERYRDGVTVGGTSAGAAVLSDPTMTGDADLKILDGNKVGVREGLGLAPNVIFDQHFLVRQRHNRLFGLIMKYPKQLGVGIDQDNAVLIENNRRMTVVGTTRVMVIDGTAKKGSFLVTFLRPGAIYDIRKRKLLAGPDLPDRISGSRSSVLETAPL